MIFNNDQECPGVWIDCDSRGRPVYLLVKVTNAQPWIGVRYGEFKRKKDAVSEAKRLAGATRSVWVEMRDHWENIAKP